MPKLTIKPKKVVEIRNALQQISENTELILNNPCSLRLMIMITETINKQVKRIDKLLPVVKFEAGKGENK